MGEPENPWIVRLERLLDPKALALALEKRIDQPLELSALRPTVAKTRLEKAFKSEVFVATPERCAVALKILGAMHSHAVSTYSDRKSFVAGLYADRSVGTSQPMFIIIGLAGTGKTTLFQRICEILLSCDVVDIDHAAGSFPVDVVSGLTVKKHSKTVSKILLSLPFVDTAILGGKPTVPLILEHARKQIFHRGISGVLVDEMQFFTSSAEASALVTELLLNLCDLDVPAFSAMNFSLVHKIYRREQEIRDRLLLKPTEVRPHELGSAWTESIAARLAVSPSAFGFTAEAVASELHALTFGIDRYLNQLLLLSYERARSDGRQVADMNDVRAAFKCQEYSSSRATVSDLQRIQAGEKVKGREDLINPLSDVSDQRSLKEKQKTEMAQAVAAARAQSQLTADEKAVVAEAEAAESAGVGSKRPKVVPIRPDAATPKTRKQTLSDGLDLFMNGKPDLKT